MTVRRLHEVEERLERNVAERAEAATRRRQAELALAVTDRLFAMVAQPGTAASTRFLSASATPAGPSPRPSGTGPSGSSSCGASAGGRAPAGRDPRAGQLGPSWTRPRAASGWRGSRRAVRRDLDCEPDAVRQAALPDTASGHQRLQPPDRARTGAAADGSDQPAGPGGARRPARAPPVPREPSWRTCATPGGS